jgi:hypothetical protein
MDEQKFIKGFNCGYLLSKHTPDIINKLPVTVEPGNDYLNGIQSGAKQYEKEKSRIHFDDLTRIRNKPKDLDRGLERE